MEAKETWVSHEGYLLYINQLTKDIIAGNFEISLDEDQTLIPFTGLRNVCGSNQMEFCFVIDWHLYLVNGNCYTTFIGKNFFENNIEYVSLKWLFVHEINKPEQPNLSIRGTNKFTKVLEKFSNQRLRKEFNNLPHPFFIDTINTSVGLERHRN